MKCHYCGSSEAELRPYGPGGAQVCFPCAMENPEREAQAKAAFGSLLDASDAISPVNVTIIGQPSGPQPYVPTSASSLPEAEYPRG